jgi:hypothetical protein
MILKLTNNKNTYSFEVEDLNNGEKLFYHFQIPTADMEDGKYNMVLLDGDEIVAEEQVCIGAFNPQTIQYSRGENVYINAPFEANLEDVKEVEITAINTTVLPSEGYDGVKVVEVNAQPIYDEGYNEGENIGYNSGYTAGDIDGYNRGYNEGETGQKAKLSAITITENGTYSREDGYNEITVDVIDLNGDYNEGYDAGKIDGYDSGYTAGIDYASENAGEIAAANAIVLDATENKTYYTKYADIPAPEFITGEYPNGEKFYDYANLTDIVYNTGIQVTPDTRFELWWKQDKADGSYSTIIGAQGRQIMKIAEYNGSYVAEYGGRAYYFDMPYGWNHIIFSKADGVVVNGEQVVDLSDATGQNYPDVIYINASFLSERDYNANGSFGMIKINDTIIIPTPDGFLNSNTNEMLSVAYTADGGGYVYKNQEIIPIDNLIKQVNVNVKIDVFKYGLKFANSTFAEIPDFYDFSNVKDYSYMFDNCSNLQTIPLMDFKNATTMRNAFSNCGSLKIIPNLDLSNVDDSSYMFRECGSLIEVGNLNLEKTRNLSYFLFCTWNNRPLEKIGVLNVPNVENLNDFFYYSFSPMTVPNLTEMGGFVGLKCNWNDGNGLDSCPNLTYQSCINILNGLADVTELGGRTLKVHQNFLTTVGDEISIGTSKNWVITA